MGTAVAETWCMIRYRTGKDEAPLGANSVPPMLSPLREVRVNMIEVPKNEEMHLNVSRPDCRSLALHGLSNAGAGIRQHRIPRYELLS